MLVHEKKEKSAKTEIKGYENHLKDCVASDSTGLMIMHRTKDKVLVEFPVRLLEKEMLLASSIINISDNGEGVVGQFTSPEVMFRFVRNGKKLEARMMTNQPLMREETGKEGVASSLLKSASGGVYKSFKIEAFAKTVLRFWLTWLLYFWNIRITRILFRLMHLIQCMEW